MIEKATDTFWKNLNGLGFLDLPLLQKWRALAETPGATWLQLCQAIQQESQLTAAHLQLLTNEHPWPPVQVGGLLIQRPILHPIQWDAFQAVHVKLEKEWRVVIPPAEPRDATANDILSRARRIAELDDPQLTKVIDIETYGSRLAMVLPLVRGQRLSQIWSNPQADLNWEQIANQLVSALRRIHDAGVDIGSLDPLMIYYDAEREAIQFDDLVASHYSDDDVIPGGLSPSEEAVVIAYRTHRARFFATNRLGTAPRPSTARDWLECAAWLTFAADHRAATKASAATKPPAATPTAADALTERWKQAATQLAAIYNGSQAELNAWYERWFDATAGQESALADPALQVFLPSQIDQDTTPLPNVLVGSPKSPSAPDDHAPVANPSFATLGTSPREKSPPGSLANKQAAKRQIEKRRKWVMAAAVIVPLPICLLVMLVIYALQPAEERVPDLANQTSSQEELPGADLPDVQLPNNSNAKETKSPVQNNRGLASTPGSNLGSNLGSTPDAKPVGPSGGSGNRSGPPSPEKSQRIPPNAGDESAADEDEALADLRPLPDNDLLTGPSEPPKPPLDPLPTPVADPPAETKLGTSEQPTPAAPADDGFVSYTHLLTEVDVVGAWREALQANPTDKLNRTVQLGQLNRTTAKRTLAALNSMEPTIGDNFRLVAQPAPESPIVQQWDLQRVNANEPKTLALIQATTDGRLQMVLSPAPVDDWDETDNLKLELYFGDRSVSHWIALGQGRRPDLMTAENTAVAGATTPTIAAPSGNDTAMLPGTSTAENKPSGAAAEAPIPDLAFDPKTAASKTWFKDTPDMPREGTQWQFQLAGKPLQKIDKEHPLWKALRVRGKEEAYFMDDLLDAGSVVVLVTADAGNRTRLEGRLQLLTPSGPRPLKTDAAADAAVEAEQFKQTVKAQFDQLKGTRAKPGEGDLKQAELNRMETVMKEMDRYKKALEFVVQNNDALLENGLAFGLLHVMDGQEQYLLKSEGFTVTNPAEK
jgi:hypothetical protein